MPNKYYQGIYKLKNKQKYKGDPNNVIFRSSWELKVLKYLDEHPSIIWFASEELFIPYINPIDKKKHRYFPDFILRVRKKDGNEETHMWEVKPYKQTQLPEQKRKTKRFLQESMTYAINQEKWRAAELFCLEHGWKFSIITEKDLGL
jgi:hypothetical protein